MPRLLRLQLDRCRRRHRGNAAGQVGPYRLRNCSKVSSEPSSRTSFAMASRAPYLSTSRLKYGTLPGPKYILLRLKRLIL
jgi:hypothetical protein